MNSAIQHRKCLLALTAITVFIEQLKPSGTNTKFDQHISKIRRWLEACCNDVRKKKLSSGAKRDLDLAFNRIAELTAVNCKDGDALFNSWASSMWASLTLLEDCRNCCKEWFVGKHWKYLLQTLNTMCMGLLVVDDRVAECGTELYEMIAD